MLFRIQFPYPFMETDDIHEEFVHCPVQLFVKLFRSEVYWILCFYQCEHLVTDNLFRALNELQFGNFMVISAEPLHNHHK